MVYFLEEAAMAEDIGKSHNYLGQDVRYEGKEWKDGDYGVI